MKTHKVVVKKMNEEIKVVETESVVKVIRENLDWPTDRANLGGGVLLGVPDIYRNTELNMILMSSKGVEETIQDAVVFYKIDVDIEVGLSEKEIESILAATTKYDNDAAIFDIEIFHKKMGWV